MANSLDPDETPRFCSASSGSTLVVNAPLLNFFHKRPHNSVQLILSKLSL